jgi:hypothetical protein
MAVIRGPSVPLQGVRRFEVATLRITDAGRRALAEMDGLR